MEKLYALRDLLMGGMVTEEEYQNRRAQILNDHTRTFIHPSDCSPAPTGLEPMNEAGGPPPQMDMMGMMERPGMGMMPGEDFAPPPPLSSFSSSPSSSSPSPSSSVGADGFVNPNPPNLFAMAGELNQEELPKEKTWQEEYAEPQFRPEQTTKGPKSALFAGSHEGVDKEVAFEEREKYRQKEERVKIYFRSMAYREFPVNKKTTVEQVCEMVAAHLQLKRQANLLTVYDSIEGKETALGPKNLVLRYKNRWPEFLDEEQKNVTSFKCFLICAPINGANRNFQMLYRKHSYDYRKYDLVEWKDVDLGKVVRSTLDPLAEVFQRGPQAHH
eukprot:CAMPEP_0201484850 /NCGR_PEP_ID=MMETSP0151_2-20130828/9003_1 /ASSEMBLY_ACC=CAM_ASM_000257 /TAXON_ID=200890 /ORGANISM="Paramoeba atlantica, Strain 621/1 / CCAP 1560/9" /LENGTH=328 /DNA_ID=CAMNT_0047868705 /DNA_START=11 /DNA_END=997 /DNA_ORIENTATION=-